MEKKLLKEILSFAHEELDPIYGKSEVTALMAILLEHYAGISYSMVLAEPNLEFATDRQRALLDAVQKLKIEQLPIQYLLGYTTFCDLDYKVSSGVLIPRPETEELVREVIKIEQKKGLRVLDIGTGSGCIAISISKFFPDKVAVTAIDISPQALEQAQYNAALVNASVRFRCVDILSGTSFFVSEKFDVIISNPPYVCEKEKMHMRQNVLDHEPSLALFVPDTDPLLFYRSIGDFASRHLEPNGRLYLEINESLSEETKNCISSFGFLSEIREDLFGKKRFLFCQKIAQ